MDGEKDLDGYYRQASRVTREIAAADSMLAPYWDAKASIEAAIMATHDRDATGRVRFNFGKAPERQRLFEALLQNTMHWGPVRSARATLKADLKYYEREIERIEYDIAAEKRKQQRRLL